MVFFFWEGYDAEKEIALKCEQTKGKFPEKSHLRIKSLAELTCLGLPFPFSLDPGNSCPCLWDVTIFLPFFYPSFFLGM